MSNLKALFSLHEMGVVSGRAYDCSLPTWGHSLFSEYWLTKLNSPTPTKSFKANSSARQRITSHVTNPISSPYPHSPKGRFSNPVLKMNTWSSHSL